MVQWGTSSSTASSWRPLGWPALLLCPEALAVHVIPAVSEPRGLLSGFSEVVLSTEAFFSGCGMKARS